LPPATHTITIAKKININQDDQAIIPGSVEEDLLKGSDDYFKWNQQVVSNCIVIYIAQFGPLYDTNGALIPWSIAGSVKLFEKEEEENKVVETSLTSTRSKAIKNSKKNLSQHSIYQRNSKGKLVPLSDEELQKRMEAIEKRINENRDKESVNEFQNEQNKVIFTKGDHVLLRKEKVDNDWTNTINALSNKIKRPAEQSIINKADQYREKVEKLIALELATPSDVKYGAQNWYLSLRASPYFNDIKHYLRPIGNSVNGLYLRMTDNPNARADIIRKPQAASDIGHKTFKDYPYYKEKMKKESKKIGEIMSGKDDEVDGLIVI